ncbi:MAG: WXG100 family type VII secretion target [Aggregatilineales bacterium]
MAHIAVNPKDMQIIAAALRAHSSRVQSAVESIEVEMARLSADQFSGQRAEAVRMRFQAMRPRLAQYAALLSKFADQLEEAAEAFRRADAVHGQAASSGAFQLTTTFSLGDQAARVQAAQAAMRTVSWRKLW